MKMYICIKDDVPKNFVPVISAHASLACYLKYKDSEIIQEWLDKSFRKVIVKVNEKEFNKAKELDSVVLTESALDGIEVAVAIPPMVECPKFMKYLQLYKFN